jgi:hypothetical protein
VSEDPKDEKFMWDVISAAKNKAYEHREYSIRLDNPNDLTIKGMEQLRRGEPGFFTEEDIALYGDTVHDDAFELGVQRGAEEMLASILERLGVERLAEAESYVSRGKQENS